MNQEVYDAIVRPVAFCGHVPFDVRGVNTCRVSSWSVCTSPREHFSLENFKRRRVRAPTTGWSKSAIHVLTVNHLHKAMFCPSTIMVTHKH